MGFFDERDILELSLLSKRYYTHLFGELNLIREDHQELLKKSKGLTPKSKPAKKEEGKKKED